MKEEGLIREPHRRIAVPTALLLWWQVREPWVLAAWVSPGVPGAGFDPSWCGSEGWPCLQPAADPPGSWLELVADCEAPGFQTISKGSGELGRSLALGSLGDPCACAELKKQRLGVLLLIPGRLLGDNVKLDLSSRSQKIPTVVKSVLCFGKHLFTSPFYLYTLLYWHKISKWPPLFSCEKGTQTFCHFAWTC